MSKPVIIIYHDNCVDGFAAAWVANKYWFGKHEIKLRPAKYGEEPPYELCKDAIVMVVDFSYPREKLLQLDSIAFDLTVIDHHKSAFEDLTGLNKADIRPTLVQGLPSFCVFDMEKSGAGLTWDTLFQGQPRPVFIDYVEDRDLWRWELPGSKAVNAYIGVVERTLEEYDKLAAATWSQMVSWGSGGLMQLEYYAQQTAKLGRSIELFEPGQLVWCVNCSPVGVSEVCDYHLKRLDMPEVIVMGWYINEGKLLCSLRSLQNTDVSAIAKSFGGGGHKNAAGFKLELPDPFLNKLLGVEL